MMEDLSEEERRALRGSKFAPLPSQPTSSRSHPRLAHPGGPLKTNKAAALAKFLDRKLHQDPNGLSNINPQILELAVRNAKASVLSSSYSPPPLFLVSVFLLVVARKVAFVEIMKNIDHKFTTTTNQLSFSSLYSGSGTNIRHVDTFDDPEASFDDGEAMNSEPKKQKNKNKKNKKNKNKKTKKNKRQKKIVEDSGCGVGKRPKKKLKL
ncbi:hypothetical protein SDJN02_20495 [Cucurbita argyrosperma subsp. argyrosperma]|nr:hypothetical protein SDJN02_20495 [Cucurbita argyrosperma subsp. argyrosperma]